MCLSYFSPVSVLCWWCPLCLPCLSAQAPCAVLFLRPTMPHTPLHPPCHSGPPFLLFAHIAATTRAALSVPPALFAMPQSFIKLCVFSSRGSCLHLPVLPSVCPHSRLPHPNPHPIQACLNSLSQSRLALSTPYVPNVCAYASCGKQMLRLRLPCHTYSKCLDPSALSPYAKVLLSAAPDFPCKCGRRCRICPHATAALFGAPNCVPAYVRVTSQCVCSRVNLGEECKCLERAI